MKMPSQITRRQVLITVLLAIAMVFSFLAGTISVEAGLFMQDETRASSGQIAAISAAVSLLLLDEEEAIEPPPPPSTKEIFLPLIVR